jgi:hypothetical protein
MLPHAEIADLRLRHPAMLAYLWNTQCSALDRAQFAAYRDCVEEVGSFVKPRGQSYAQAALPHRRLISAFDNRVAARNKYIIQVGVA